MSWIDRLQTASFRGVVFWVESHETGTGRRLAEFEFPLLDAGQVDDLGKRTPRYRIRAFVIGDNYDQQRDALVAACANPHTAGTLVHPYITGNRQVRCANVTVREQMSRGGIAELDLEFVLAGPIPVSTADTSSSLLAGVVSALGVIRTAYALTMLVVDNPGVLISAAVGLLGVAAGDLLGNLTGLPSSVLDGLVADADAMFAAPASQLTTADAVSTAFLAAADAAVAQQAALPDPSQPVDPVTGYDATAVAPGDPSYGLAAMAVWAGGSAVSPYTGTSGSSAAGGVVVTQQLVNQQAIVNLVCDTAVLAMASVYTQTSWSSSDAAAAARSQLLDLMDGRADAAAAAGSQPVYLAWLAMAALATADLTQQVQQLPRLLPYTTRSSLPSLALSQRLYGDAAHALELAALNDAIHPLFMPIAGQALSA